MRRHAYMYTCYCSLRISEKRAAVASCVHVDGMHSARRLYSKPTSCDAAHSITHIFTCTLACELTTLRRATSQSEVSCDHDAARSLAQVHISVGIATESPISPRIRYMNVQICMQCSAVQYTAIATHKHRLTCMHSKAETYLPFSWLVGSPVCPAATWRVQRAPAAAASVDTVRVDTAPQPLRCRL